MEATCTLLVMFSCPLYVRSGGNAVARLGLARHSTAQGNVQGSWPISTARIIPNTNSTALSVCGASITPGGGMCHHT
jgi:hypothetical protein